MTLKHLQHGSRRLEEERRLTSKEEMTIEDTKVEDLLLKGRIIVEVSMP